MTKAGKALAVLLTTAAITLGHISTALGETFYRWEDDRGRPVHSDRPPPKGVDYEVVSTDTSLIRPVEAEAGAVPKKVTPTPSNDFEPVETREAMIEKNPEYCERAKQNLETLDGPARIRLRNDQGEYRYIDEKEKEVQREEARNVITAHCE
jgi:hypothetical protein